MTKRLFSRLMPLACFAGVALSSLSAFAAGPSSADSPASGLDSLPLSLRDTLSLPVAEASGGEVAFADSTAEATPQAGAPGLTSLDAGAKADPSAPVALGGDTPAAFGDELGASPMLVEPGFGARPLGGSVAEALAGMKGGEASPMIGDGVGGSPLFFSGLRGSGAFGNSAGGGLMTMGVWSTSW